MSNLLRPLPGVVPTPAERVPSIRKIKEINGLRGDIRKYAAREIPQVDPPEAEKNPCEVDSFIRISIDPPEAEERAI